jgi:hypothetical protein
MSSEVRTKTAYLLSDGRRAISCALDIIYVWDLDSGSKLTGFSVDNYIQVMRVIPDTDRIVIGDGGGRVMALDVPA